MNKNKTDKNNSEISEWKKQICFKPLPYDKTFQYERLQKRLESIPDSFLVAKKTLRRWQYFSMAAAITLLFISTIHLFVADKPAELVWYEVQAVSDAKTKVILPDSTEVWLNANAMLKYPREFSGDNRAVKIKGEVFFNVRKEEKPFIVELDELYIQVLGTSFNILMEEDTGQMEVTLLEGKVAIYHTENTTGMPNYILTPNEQFLYRKETKETMISTIRPEAYTSWITGKFRFEGNTLADIVRELQRAYHVKIYIENEALREQTFYATFTDNETLDEILSLLQIPERYTIENRRGQIWLK